MIGTSLGPYELTGRLGAGGMGDVYLARDTRLDRQVAVKVLPEEFASIPERLARFEQEARAAAALNHPNIAVVHDVGFEKEIDGFDEGVHYFVQEYLEGRTLREVMEAGAKEIDLGRALELSLPVIRALAAAHRAGIVHRDLKPENVFVTADGHVKVLDFGLAKLTELSMVASSDDGMTKSPTMLGTVAGQIMGTAGYMAPEQVEGGDVDSRSDIFAFGCVLYELVSSRRAFSGRSVHETLSRIVHEEPATLREIDADLPAELQRLLRKCLAKEPARRYQHVDDLIVDLEDLLAGLQSGSLTSLRALSGAATAVGEPSQEGAPATVAGNERRRLGPSVPVTVAAIAGVVLVALAVAAGRWWAPAEEPRLQRFSISITEVELAPATEGRIVAISPDGDRMAFVGIREGVRRLFVRSRDRLEADEIPGSEGAHQPFFSPDGEWIAFFDANALKKVAVAGGRPFELCDARPPYNGTWDGDTIYFTADDGKVRKVSSAGGDPIVVIEPDGDAGDQFISVNGHVPGEELLLLTVGRAEGPFVAAWSVATGERTELFPQAFGPAWIPSGHLVLGRMEGDVVVVPFDPDRVEITGDPRPVPEPITVGANGALNFGVSSEGTMLYLPGGAVDVGNVELVWVDRSGDPTPVIEEKRAFDVPRLSPDGSRIAVAVGPQGGRDLWILDLLPEPVLRRWTFEDDDRHPAWSHDGDRIAFRSADRQETTGLFSKDAHDSVKPAGLLLETPDLANIGGWSPSREMIYHQVTADSGRDVMVLADGEAEPRVWLGTRFDERSPVLSPDGRWAAYVSNQSGQNEVYVRPFPGPDPEYAVSNQGGLEPMWARDGREIFYRDLAGRMVAVRVETDPVFRIVGRSELFDAQPYLLNTARAAYDLHPDGERILMVRLQENGPVASRLDVVLAWIAEIERLAPPTR